MPNTGDGGGKVPKVPNEGCGSIRTRKSTGERQGAMPDITMCTGAKGEGASYRVCPLRASCYRYTAAPNAQWQAYMREGPFIEGSDGSTRPSARHIWTPPMLS